MYVYSADHRDPHRSSLLYIVVGAASQGGLSFPFLALSPGGKGGLSLIVCRSLFRPARLTCLPTCLSPPPPLLPSPLLGNSRVSTGLKPARHARDNKSTKMKGEKEKENLKKTPEYTQDPKKKVPSSSFHLPSGAFHALARMTSTSATSPRLPTV